MCHVRGQQVARDVSCLGQEIIAIPRLTLGGLHRPINFVHPKYLFTKIPHKVLVYPFHLLHRSRTCLLMFEVKWCVNNFIEGVWR